MPVGVIAGSGDRIIAPGQHAVRLHVEIAHSDLLMQQGAGHMPHYADPEPILDPLRKLETDAGGAAHVVS